MLFKEKEKERIVTVYEQKVETSDAEMIPNTMQYGFTTLLDLVLAV